MKIRFVEEYNPVTGRTHWFTQKRWFPGWFYVIGTMGSTLTEGRALFERVKLHGTKRTLRVIESASL